MDTFEARIRTARKQYRCESGPYGVCNKIINVGDTYFAYTLISPTRYKTRKYCLECAQLHHRDLLQRASALIKNPKKQKTARAKLGRVKFLGIKAKQFKAGLTNSEQFLWDYLRSKKLGVAFQRQTVLHGYVVDFWCPQAQLVVELDGARHRSNRESDQRRDEVMRSHGIKVLRFPSALVYSDLRFILERIEEHLKDKS